MLYRKIEKVIEAHLKSDSNKILLIDGARQVGKTYASLQSTLDKKLQTLVFSINYPATKNFIVKFSSLFQ